MGRWVRSNTYQLHVCIIPGYVIAHRAKKDANMRLIYLLRIYYPIYPKGIRRMVHIFVELLRTHFQLQKPKLNVSFISTHLMQIFQFEFVTDFFTENSCNCKNLLRKILVVNVLTSQCACIWHTMRYVIWSFSLS